MVTKKANLEYSMLSLTLSPNHKFPHIDKRWGPQCICFIALQARPHQQRPHLLSAVSHTEAAGHTESSC